MSSFCASEWAIKWTGFAEAGCLTQNGISFENGQQSWRWVWRIGLGDFVVHIFGICRHFNEIYVFQDANV